MEAYEMIESPQLKIIHENLEIDFQIEFTEKSFEHELSEVNKKLIQNRQNIDGLDVEIARLTNTADGLDYIVAVGSGILAGVVDSLWVGEFNFERGKEQSNKTVNEFVMQTAKAQGYEGERLDGAIKFLEDKYQIPSDNIWKGKNVGISAKSHHLDDLAHHPTPIGLFFSILTQFTKEGYFQNSEGEFLPITIDENEQDLIGNSIPTKFFAGTVNWFFHLVSDMSGSNKTAGVGMGIPGPIVSLLKEISMIPGLNKTDLAKKMKEIFVQEKFDLRSELAVGYELKRQALPIILNEVIVRAFYFARRLLIELKETPHINAISWKKTLPYNNRTIVRMLTIATGTFTLVDIGDAAIRGAIKSDGEMTQFTKEFFLRVNFVGVGRFTIAVITDVSMGIKRQKRRDERIALYSEQLHLMNAKVYYLQAGAWKTAESAEKSIDEAIVLMEKTAFFAVETWDANRLSINSIASNVVGAKEHNKSLVDDVTQILIGRK